ncbi:MAG: HD domain-containing protein [Bacteroidota bacterium]|nr:HD domain-containing protein [Bacteroidota bacterium]
MNDLAAIYSFLHSAEKLKFELRHSYTSSGRQESVAEHTWRMTLMAILLQPKLDKRLNFEKLLKMIVIHDIVEIEAGDTPVPRMVGNEVLKKLKQTKELKAIENIRTHFGNETGEEIFSLWNEFEARETYEAKVAFALDKLEVQIQHNEADIATWEPIEYQLVHSRRPFVEFDSTLTTLCDLIEREAEEKMKAAGVDINTITHKEQ